MKYEVCRGECVSEGKGGVGRDGEGEGVEGKGGMRRGRGGRENRGRVGDGSAPKAAQHPTP